MVKKSQLFEEKKKLGYETEVVQCPFTQSDDLK